MVGALSEPTLGAASREHFFAVFAQAGLTLGEIGIVRTAARLTGFRTGQTLIATALRFAYVADGLTDSICTALNTCLPLQ